MVELLYPFATLIGMLMLLVLMVLGKERGKGILRFLGYLLAALVVLAMFGGDMLRAILRVVGVVLGWGIRVLAVIVVIGVVVRVIRLLRRRR